MRKNTLLNASVKCQLRRRRDRKDLAVAGAIRLGVSYCAVRRHYRVCPHRALRRLVLFETRRPLIITRLFLPTRISTSSRPSILSPHTCQSAQIPTLFHACTCTFEPQLRSTSSTSPARCTQTSFSSTQLGRELLSLWLIRLRSTTSLSAISPTPGRLICTDLGCSSASPSISCRDMRPWTLINLHLRRELFKLP